MFPVSAGQVKDQIMASIAVKNDKVAGDIAQAKRQLSAASFFEVGTILSRQQLVRQGFSNFPVQRLGLKWGREFPSYTRHRGLARHHEKRLRTHLCCAAQCAFEIKRRFFRQEQISP